MARARESLPMSGKPRLALKTNFRRKLRWGGPASAEYLLFCSKEKGSVELGKKRALRISRLAAYHGHLPLLQELLEPSEMPDEYITMTAGEFSFSLSRLLFILASDMFLAFSSSQCAEVNWRPCSG